MNLSARICLWIVSTCWMFAPPQSLSEASSTARTKYYCQLQHHGYNRGAHLRRTQTRSRLRRTVVADHFRGTSETDQKFNVTIGATDIFHRMYRSIALDDSVDAEEQQNRSESAQAKCRQYRKKNFTNRIHAMLLHHQHLGFRTAAYRYCDDPQIMNTCQHHWLESELSPQNMLLFHHLGHYAMTSTHKSAPESVIGVTSMVEEERAGHFSQFGVGKERSCTGESRSDRLLDTIEEKHLHKRTDSKYGGKRKGERKGEETHCKQSTALEEANHIDTGIDDECVDQELDVRKSAKRPSESQGRVEIQGFVEGERVNIQLAMKTSERERGSRTVSHHCSTGSNTLAVVYRQCVGFVKSRAWRRENWRSYQQTSVTSDRAYTLQRMRGGGRIPLLKDVKQTTSVTSASAVTPCHKGKGYGARCDGHSNESMSDLLRSQNSTDELRRGKNRSTSKQVNLNRSRSGNYGAALCRSKSRHDDAVLRRRRSKHDTATYRSRSRNDEIALRCRKKNVAERL